MVASVDENSIDTFKYVKIHREHVKTLFTQHEVLQIIDVSQKVGCEKA